MKYVAFVTVYKFDFLYRKDSSNSEREDSGSKPVINIEERPINAPKKTFEELLAEQLGLEPPESEPTKTPQTPAFVKRTPATGSGKTFLKKKSGLARFGGVGSPPKGFRRSVSQNAVAQGGTPASIRSNRIKPSTSCSKLDIADRETIAFASKKLSPKKTQNSIKSTTPSATSSRSTSNNSLAKSISNSQLSKGATLQKPANSSSANVKPLRLVKNGSTASPKNSSPMSSNKREVEEAPRVVQVDAAVSVDDDDDVSTATSVHDSVEHSFREKLKKADKNHKVTTLDS